MCGKFDFEKFKLVLVFVTLFKIVGIYRSVESVCAPSLS